ncbi:hypothetical protein BU17DRAFT_89072 [Hysterangium stoloniferum]|nr:hypothetical protein BU17DRAFT_89072 [Hysterangium stoloniferum]
MSSSVPIEREIPLIQRGFVDNCFEEGQYEYGIDALDKLRGPNYKPPQLHVRTLVYIALYPLPPKPSNNVERIEMFLSPRKIQAQRHRDDMWPKPTSRPLAISLLRAFIDTNSPECLMRALPFHTYTDSDGVKDVNPFTEADLKENHEDNSPLKNELAGMQSRKDCWEMLKVGFIKRKQQDHRSRMDNTAIKDDSEELPDPTVGPYAWPLLEWMIHVFEKNQCMKKAVGQPSFSPLLLMQIPPPRSKKGPRWEVDVPVQVAMACLAPDSSELLTHGISLEKRQELGSRLVALLVNLTLTMPPLLSPSHLMRTLTLKLLDLPFKSLLSMLVSIPSDHMQFKISLLESCLASGVGGSTEAINTTKAGTVAPRAKPKPSAKRVNATVTAEPVVPPPNAAKGQPKETYAVPSQDRLVHLLSAPLPPLPKADSRELSPVKTALVKFHLISTLYNLRIAGRLAIADWDPVVRSGTMQIAVVNGITGNLEKQDDPDYDMIEVYRANALEVVKVWMADSDGGKSMRCPMQYSLDVSKTI